MIHALRGIVSYPNSAKFLSEDVYNTEFIQHVYTTHQYNTHIDN